MSKTGNNVEAVLRAIVIKNSRMARTSVADGDMLVGDLGFDSLAFLLTLTDLEEKFKVTFPVEKVDEFRNLSFRGLVRLVNRELLRTS